jgi:hypothetical protein
MLVRYELAAPPCGRVSNKSNRKVAERVATTPVRPATATTTVTRTRAEAVLANLHQEGSPRGACFALRGPLTR